MGFNQGEQANTAGCFILPRLSLHDEGMNASPQTCKKKKKTCLFDLLLIQVNLNVTFSKHLNAHVQLFSASVFTV